MLLEQHAGKVWYWFEQGLFRNVDVAQVRDGHDAVTQVIADKEWGIDAYAELGPEI